MADRVVPQPYAVPATELLVVSWLGFDGQTMETRRCIGNLGVAGHHSITFIQICGIPPSIPRMPFPRSSVRLSNSKALHEWHGRLQTGTIPTPSVLPRIAQHTGDPVTFDLTVSVMQDFDLSMFIEAGKQPSECRSGILGNGKLEQVGQGTII